AWASATDAGPDQMYIDGRWVDAQSGARFTCTDPYTEEAWGSVPEASAADVDRAVQAAHRAFTEGEWRRTLPAGRFAALRRLGQLLEGAAEELAVTQVRENGKVITEMRGGARSLAADSYYFGALAETLHGYTVEPGLPNFPAFTRREPIGVVAAI